MQALMCRSFDGFAGLAVETGPEPAATPGQLRIAVAACGVNFADTLIVNGQYQERPAFPFSPGLEVAGTVLDTAPDVETFAPGDRVVALVPYGGYAQVVAADAATTLALPDGLDMTTAAGFIVAYGTAHVGLDHRAGLKSGETVLIHGAAGGVGLAAVEIAKRMGARVIATASTDAKRALARDHGADEVIDYTAGGFKDKVRELTGGRGVDVVFDPVGGAVFEESLRAVAWGGRIVVIGFASGEVAKAPTNHILVKDLSILGLYWGAYAKRAPDVLRQSLSTLLTWWAEGDLRPFVSQRYPLDDAVSALTAIAGRKSTGKLVITMPEPL